MTEPPRPISVPPKRQPTKNARYFLMAALYISGCVLTIVSLVLLQIPALILWYLPLLLIPFVTQDAAESVKRWSFHLFKVYIGLTEQVFGSWVIISTWMFVPGSIIITGDAELMQESMQSVVIANHQAFPDWLYLWNLAHRFNRSHAVKIFLMQSLANVPLAGTGMRFFDFIFLARKLAKDHHNIIGNLSRSKRYAAKYPLWLLMFPEGTLNTPNNRITSEAFATKNNIEERPRFVILPKSTGLYISLQTLLPEINNLFDVTVGYGGLTPDQIPYEEYLVENCFFAGIYPREVHMYIRHFAINTIPGLAASESSLVDHQIHPESLNTLELNSPIKSEATNTCESNSPMKADSTNTHKLNSGVKLASTNTPGLKPEVILDSTNTHKLNSQTRFDAEVKPKPAIPADINAEKFSLWLRKLYMDKDDLMHTFYATGKFPRETSTFHEKWEFKPSNVDLVFVGGAWISLAWTLPYYANICLRVGGWTLALVGSLIF